MTEKKGKIKMKRNEEFKVGDEIFVSGDVEYGDDYYRVSTKGIVQMVDSQKLLATLEYVDGDFGVTVWVEKSDAELYEDWLKETESLNNNNF